MLRYATVFAQDSNFKIIVESFAKKLGKKDEDE